LILASDDLNASKRVMRQMKELENRKEELEKALAEAEEPPPLLHPNMAEIYRQRISALHESLRSNETKAEAAEIVRTLVDRVTLVPEEGLLSVVLRGDLAAMLRFAAGKKKPDLLSEVGLIGDLLSPTSMVAGTRNTRFLRLAEGVIPQLAA
jgi:site-specific DNA recombinase